MVAGKCPSCGNEYKNLGAHRCKAMKVQPTDPIEETIEQKVEATTEVLENLDIKPAMTSEPSQIPVSPQEATPSMDSVEEPKYNFSYDAPVKPSIWKRLFSRKPKPEKKKVNISDLFDSLPKWSIKERKPWGKPKNKNASWIQIVAFSRTRPPKAIWAEYDGVSVSVDDMFFPAPHDIRGDIFPYDMDKGVPLLDNSDQYNDMSYWNKLVERVKNMYFTLGLISGAGDFTKNIGLILLLVGVSILAVIINIILTYSLSKDFSMAAANIGNITYQVNNYIATHP